ncbi:MAG TPA: PaaI family thioesterase [Actinomycetota bacterium]|nr:PaaI family thioesterase [Actinomycetota bacterium]
MSFWGDMLDAIVAGTGEPPPMVVALKLPTIQGWEPGSVWGDWPLNKEMYHAAGSVFGGYLAALADSFTGLAMFTVLTDQESFTTSDLRLAFFRPVTTDLHIVAEVLNRGRRQAHVEATFVDDRDKVAAKATATQVILPMSELQGGSS